MHGGCKGKGQRNLLTGKRNDALTVTLLEHGMKKTLAILPFKCGLAGQQYIGDGLADELYHSLTRIREIHQPPDVDTITFRDMDSDIGQAASALGVRYILNGEAAYDNGDIKIAAKLHDTEKGSVLFERNERVPAAEVGDELDRILHELASSLEAMPMDPASLTVQKGWTSNTDAYLAYLRGLAYYRTVGADNNLRAQEQFEKALKLDRQFAKCWARLAECFAKYFINHDANDQERVEKAGKAAANALKLMPTFPRPYAILGLVKSTQGKYVEADDYFKQAIERHPWLFDAWFWRAQAAFEQGLLKRAIEYFEKASEVQPQDYQALLLLRQAYMSAGRPEESKQAAIRGIKVAQEHLRVNPRDARAIYLVAGSMFQIGQYNEALKWAERALEVDPDDPMINYNVACCFAQAGEPERALDCLEKVQQSNIVSASWMKNDSDLFSLHDEPRFKAMIAGSQQAG